jgi:signal transduction histidine kinase
LFALAWAIGAALVLTSRGSAAIALFSLVSQGILYLPSQDAGLVVGASALVSVPVLWMTAAEPQKLHAVAGFGAALAFVVVFSGMVSTKERARLEIARLAADLAQANERLRAYAREAQELTAAKERNRIAREIHDGLGHYLTVVHVQLQAAQATIEREPGVARAALAKAQQLTHEGLEEIRRSVGLLRGASGPPRALAHAIGELAKDCSADGLRADVLCEGVPRPLPDAVEYTLLRAAQEALTNVRRHARASSVDIVLAFSADARVRLRVADDGVGCSEPARVAERGFGLLGLRERAELVGGKLSIEAAHGRGFALELEVPG